MTNIGLQLKQAREDKGYTLKQTAEKAGLSIGFISQVENGLTDPSLSSLRKLTDALSIKLGDLFEHDKAPHVCVRNGEGSILQIDSHVYCEMLANSLNKSMEPMIKVIAPGGGSGTVEPHIGEEFVYVLEGELRVSLEDKGYILRKGDSIYFSGNQRHAWKNSAKKECRVLWVMSPPFYD